MYKKDNYIYKNLSQAQTKKRKRLYNRILKMLKENKNILFLTFTFNESILKTTNSETRQRYIKTYLNEQTSEYILNIDYGKTNKREHYHAIAKPKYKLIVYTAYKYGLIKGERINQLKRFTRANKSLEDIAESLTQHATKNSTKDNKIIYSRAPRKSESKYKNQIDDLLINLDHKRPY